MTADQRIDADRREKWVEYRRKHNMADDAPFVGGCPWRETYQEMLDALNYLDQAGQGQWVDAYVGVDQASAKLAAQGIARICLRRMETKGGPE